MRSILRTPKYVLHRAQERKWILLVLLIGFLGACQDSSEVFLERGPSDSQTQVETEFKTKPRGPQPTYSPTQYTFPGYEKIKGKKTGFFHVEKHGEKWWLIDPNGFGSFAIAVNQFRPKGWAVPKKEGGVYYPYHETILEKYGSEKGWAKAASQRMWEWGFNAISSRTRNFKQPLIYTTFCAAGTYFTRRNKLAKEDVLISAGWGSLPNVFSPDWPVFCDQVARKKCAPLRDDPWLLGYFIDNERAWKKPNDFVLLVMTYSPKHTGKQAMVELAKQKFSTIENFNRAWKTNYQSFEDVLKSKTPGSALSPEATAFCEDFVRLTAEKYYSVITDAIRKHDPNHMIIGNRDARKKEIVLKVAGKFLDIYSFNTYPGIDVEKGVQRSWVDTWDSYHKLTGRPMMITEWSFVALDGGHPGTDGGGMRVLDQKERAECFKKFQTTIFSRPYMVGSFWFAWSDQPVERGIMRVRDPMSVNNENLNFGLVTEHDRPWKELTEMATRINSQACEIHHQGGDKYIFQNPTPKWNHPIPREISDVSKSEWVTQNMGDLKIVLKEIGWEMSLSGKMLGFFKPLVQQRIKGVNRYQYGEKTKIKAVYENSKFRIVDVLFDYQVKEKETYEDELNQSKRGVKIKPAAFQMTWRFWIPKSEKDAWFGAECLLVENKDDRPWELVAVYYSAFPKLGGKDLAYRRYFGGKNGWGWEELDEGLGMGTWNVEPISEHRHWVGKRGKSYHYHPDCRQFINIELEPGQRYEMEGPKTFHFGYEAKDYTSWLKAYRVFRKQVLSYYGEES